MPQQDTKKNPELCARVPAFTVSAARAVYVLSRPNVRAAPVVFDSPHSGFQFPRDFKPVAPRAAVRSCWDAYVDELLAGVPDAGGTLLAARFPRAYIDANRAQNDISPTVLSAPWPHPVRLSEYGRRGMGLVRGIARPGVALYRRRLTVAQVLRRIKEYYTPYRNTLRASLDAAWKRHGVVWHFNCHSMKSRAGNAPSGSASLRPDFVIGDLDGATAPPAITAWVAKFFSERGFSVKVNHPYRGADIIRSHGQPCTRRYSIQIEINRALYMHERTCRQRPYFPALRAELTGFAHAVSHLALQQAAILRTG